VTLKGRRQKPKRRPRLATREQFASSSSLLPRVTRLYSLRPIDRTPSVLSGFRGRENERQSNRGRGSIVSGHFLDDVAAAWKIADGGLTRKQANTEGVRPIVAPARSGPAAKSAT
jgi:hypothetical protein